MSEILSKNGRPLSRAMIIFALRDTCQEFMDFEKEGLIDKDILLAGILFAARDGWMGLPLSFRNRTPGLIKPIEHRMATMAHQILNTEISLGNPPQRPRSLQELFILHDNKWNKKQAEVALNIAKRTKWQCITTQITLGKGAYKMFIDGKGTHIEFEGETKAVTSAVDPFKFLEHLQTSEIEPRLLKKTYENLTEKAKP
jgi:hypothetical protein